MKTAKRDRTSDTHRLKILARVVRDYREVQRQISVTLAQGVGAGELFQRRTALEQQLDQLSQQALTSVTPGLFDGPCGLPD